MASLYPRFNRSYELTWGAGATAVTVRNPFRVTFDGTKSLGSFANRLTLDVYNLSPAKRQSLVRDELANIDNVIPVSFKVGYGDRVDSIFNGYVQRGQSVRSGTDYISRIECYDGGPDIFNAYVATTVVGSQQLADAILASTPNLTKGIVTRRPDLVRPRVLVGAAADLFAQVANGDQVFIDDGAVYIIKENDVVSLEVPVVSAETGLLSTPERDQGIVSFQTMLNPALRLAGLCKLETQSAPYLNGIYKIETINYKGDYEGSDWYQTVRAVQTPTFTLAR